MYRHRVRGFGAIAALSILFAAGIAFAQTAKDLVGTWTLVSSDAFGANPKGILMLDANGHMSATLMKSDLPRYAVNNRGQGTADENKATVQGMLTYFGTYSVQGSDLLIHMEVARFPTGSAPIRSGQISRSPATNCGGRNRLRPWADLQMSRYGNGQSRVRI